MDKSTQLKEAIILAGGLGTRLRSEIGKFPKPLAPTGGIPFLQLLLNYLSTNEITRVILAVGYKWELIEKAFGDHYNGIDLIYSVENKPLGTGGAIKLALEHTKEKSIFILNGDTLFTIPLADMAQQHTHDNSDCSIALHYIDKNTRYGNVVLDEKNQIQKFTEKGEVSAGYINGGIYILKKDALTAFKSGEVFSFETDFLAQKPLKMKLFGQAFTTYFKDIGIPEDYHQFEKDLKNSVLKKLL